MKYDASRYQENELYPNDFWDGNRWVPKTNGQGDYEQPLKAFELIPFAQIKIETAPAYLVKGVVPRVGLTVVWGPPKCGKSFLVLDLMLHVALGWEYRRRKVRKGAVVYCALEGCTAFKNRVEAFRQERLADDAANVPFHLMASPLQLVADHQALIASIRAVEPNPSAVTIDTLNRSLAGSESSDEDMTAYVQAADAIRDAFNCAVIIVHHCGHEGTRPRGHSSLMGALDAQIGVSRDTENNIIATVELMKDGTQGDEFASRLKVVELGADDEGDIISSCVVEPTNAPVHAPKATKTSGLQALYLAKYEHLADGVKPTGGYDGSQVRKVSVDAIRDELKRDGDLQLDDKHNIHQTASNRLSEAKSALKRAKILVERDGQIWRIKY